MPTMNNKYLTIEDVINRLKREIETAGNQRQFAQKINVSAAYLNDVMNRKRGPGDKILKAINLQKIVVYKAGGR